MITLEDVQALLAQMTEPVLTIYLNTDNADPTNQAMIAGWRTWLKDELDRLTAEVIEDPQDPAWRQLSEQAVDYFLRYEPDGKSLALFLGANAEGQTDAHEFRLPMPLDNHVSYGKPFVTPLLWLIDEYEPYLIVLVDQEKTNLMNAYLGRVGGEGQFKIDIDDYDFQQRSEYQLGVFAQGDFRDLYEKMIDEHRARYFREVVERIDQLNREKGYNRIIFGGVEESAQAVKNLLPKRLQEQVIGVLPIPMRSDGKAIIEKALPAALDYERAYELRLVNEVIDFAKSNGRGALGMDEVMRALEERRVELLVIPYPIAAEKLAAELPQRVMESSGQIELVHGEAADRLNAEGGIGARLYYAIPSAGNTVPTQKESARQQRGEGT